MKNRGNKFRGKRKKGQLKPTTKKKRKQAKETEVVNKKVIFNRYKNKQKVEEELQKKKYMEMRLAQTAVTYSESEDEEDAYGQLVSCFGAVKRNAVALSDEDEPSDESDIDAAMDSDQEHMTQSISMEQSSNDPGKNSENDIESSTDNENEDKSDHEIEDAGVEQEQDPPDDPFTRHLQYDLSDEMLVSLNTSPPSMECTTKTWPILGNLSILIPKPIETSNKVKPKVALLEEKTYAERGTVPHIINTLDYNKMHIKSQIHGNIVSANKTNLIKRDLEVTDVFTPLQKELFSLMNNYQDVCYSERSFSNADEIRYTYCLHAVNHMLKTRTKILHHNAKLSKKVDVNDEFRDQGLVRPKVMIIVPFKDAAYRVVNTLIDILVPKEAGQVLNKKRFEDDFTGGELLMPRKNPKPEDYELLFSGNTDDTFRIGMTVTKKTLKLYTDFYASDIIVASPLGLRMLVGAEGEEDRDFDFLASIEILVMDQTDVFLMQNWDHLLHILDHFHLQPKKTHDTDFSRVRSWAVNGWSKYYRQTLVFSSVLLPEIKSVMNRKCYNYRGKVFIENPVEVGSIRQVLLQVPQVYHRFNASNPMESVEARFQFFIKEVLPRHRDTLMSHTLIFVPSYFDYVRIRNYFKKEDIGFVQICEYSKDAKIARARDMFFHTEAHFLLYSERVHFFRRFTIKGIRHIIFYQPPTYPHFYSEMCNLMQECNQNKYGGSECNMSVSVMYCTYDVPRLCSVLGAARARRLLRPDTAIHTFLTGE